jgi:hypothetical protein
MYVRAHNVCHLISSKLYSYLLLSTLIYSAENLIISNTDPVNDAPQRYRNAVAFTISVKAALRDRLYETTFVIMAELQVQEAAQCYHQILYVPQRQILEDIDYVDITFDFTTVAGVRVTMDKCIDDILL